MPLMKIEQHTTFLCLQTHFFSKAQILQHLFVQVHIAFFFFFFL